MLENSSVLPLVENPTRRNVDISIWLADLEQAAIEDTAVDGKLYNLAEYTREVLAQFCRLRDYCRSNSLPLYRPADITNMIITGEYKEP